MSGALKPYPRYKDSGVEWLGEVPEGWEICRLKHVALIELSNVDKKIYDNETSVLLCNYVDVYYNDRITKSIEFMEATATIDQIERVSLSVGDVIITKDSEDPWDIGIPSFVSETTDFLVCGYHLALIRPGNDLSGCFLFFLLKSSYSKAYMYNAARGMTRYGVGKYPIENYFLPTPPLPEQQAIADYLDRETAKIDTLITELREMIELLKEKRQALISHCVTKGLDPNVPMKDSGVEWLGEVPEGWEICRLKHVALIELSNVVTSVNYNSRSTTIIFPGLSGG